MRPRPLWYEAQLYRQVSAAMDRKRTWNSDPPARRDLFYCTESHLYHNPDHKNKMHKFWDGLYRTTMRSPSFIY